MFRWPALFDFLSFELIEVAIAMEDGSYWADDNRVDADYYDNSSDPADWG